MTIRANLISRKTALAVVVAICVSILGATAASPQTQDVPCPHEQKGGNIHSFKAYDGQFYMQSKYAFKQFVVAMGQSCRWSIDPYDAELISATIKFDGKNGSPFKENMFTMSRGHAACSDAPVVQPDPKKVYDYTITLTVKNGLGVDELKVDPGIIIDGQQPPFRLDKNTGGDHFRSYTKVRHTK